jgi:hypothetical protein
VTADTSREGGRIGLYGNALKRVIEMPILSCASLAPRYTCEVSPLRHNISGAVLCNKNDRSRTEAHTLPKRCATRSGAPPRWQTTSGLGGSPSVLTFTVRPAPCG